MSEGMCVREMSVELGKSGRDTGNVSDRERSEEFRLDEGKGEERGQE